MVGDENVASDSDILNSTNDLTSHASKYASLCPKQGDAVKCLLHVRVGHEPRGDG